MGINIEEKVALYAPILRSPPIVQQINQSIAKQSTQAVNL